jgi:hypothetical protein
MLSRIIISVIALTGLAQAQIDPNGSYGEAGDYLFELAPGAGAYARGGGSVTDAGTDALYHNPAGIAMSDYRQIELSRMWLIEDFNFTVLSMVYPFDRAGAVGATFVSIAPNNPVQDYAWDGEHVGTHEGGERSIALTYAWAYDKKFSVGLDFKFASQSVADLSGWGFGFDAGFQLRPTEWLTLGSSLVNIYGPSITLDQEPDIYSTVFKGGAAATFWKKRIRLSLDLAKTNIFSVTDFSGAMRERANRYQAGLEFTPFDWAFLRAGINDRNHSYGVGLAAGGFRVDYAVGIPYRDENNDLGLSHFVGLHWDIGKPIPKEKKDLMDSLDIRRTNGLLENARANFLVDNFPDAMDFVEAYLKKVPGDSTAVKFRTRVRASLNATKVKVLQAEFDSLLTQKEFTQAGEIVVQVVHLNPQYENLPTMQSRLIMGKESEQKLTRADSLDPATQWDEIARLADEVLAKNPKDERALAIQKKMLPLVKAGQAKALFDEATSEYHEKKDVEKAHTLLQKALALTPENADIQTFYKTVTEALRDYFLKQVGINGGNANTEQLGKMLKLDVSDRILQARKLLKAGDWKAAEVEVSKALQQEPQNEYALALQTEIGEKRKQYAAEDQFQEALRLFNKGENKACASLLDSALRVRADDKNLLDLRRDLVKAAMQQASNKLTTFEAEGKPTLIDEARQAIEFLKGTALETEESRKLELRVEAEQEVLDIYKLIESGDLPSAEKKLNGLLLRNPDNKSASSAYKMLKEMKEVMQ